MAAVTSRVPTAAQLTDGSYPNKATTCPDVSESRHSVAITGIGGVHNADNHQSWAMSVCPWMGVTTGPVTPSSSGAGAGPSLLYPSSQHTERGPAAELIPAVG